MISFKKIMALFCALSVMTAAAGCGSDKDKGSDEAATETAEVTVSTEEETEEETEETTEEETEETTEEVTEEATEEETSEEEATEEKTDDEENDASENTSSDVDFDLDRTIGTMNYKYSSEWKESVSGEQFTYTLSDLSGAIIIQKHDASELGSLSEDLMIELLASQSEKAWESLDGMEVVSSEWVENVVNGKKCYAITYTYNISSMLTTNTTYFFANFTDSANDLFAITSTALTEDSSVDAAAKDLLSTLSFSK